MDKETKKGFRNHQVEVDAKVGSVEEGFWTNKQKELKSILMMNKMQIEDLPHVIEFNEAILNVINEKLEKIKSSQEDK